MDQGNVRGDHSRQLSRLKRIEGQVRGIGQMIEQGRYCVDILTQLQAARAALASIERDVLEDHMNACVAAAVRTENTGLQAEKLGELSELLKRAMR